MWLRTEFELGSGTTVPGGDGGDAGGFIPALASYYVHRFDEHWSAGLSLNSSFGSGFDYDDSWAGRYIVQDVELITLGLTPALGYRINDWLSVGAGFSAVFAKLEQNTAIRRVLPDSDDGRLELEDTAWGFGGSAGILIEPRPGTRFGVVYTSPVKLAFEDVASVENPGRLLEELLRELELDGVTVDMEMTIPQMVVLSAYHELSEDLAILASLDWEDHSEFGKTQASLRSKTSRSFTLDRGLKDTWHASIGLQYRPAERWLVTAGFAYDSSPVSRSNRTVDLPLDRQLRGSAGVLYDLSQSVTLGLAYTYVNLGDAPLDQSGPLWGRLQGRYDRNEIHVWALTLSWKFGEAPAASVAATATK
jgi:long-chain fatty acid transport protein